MKRNFVVGMFGGLIGSVMLLIVLSATGIVGARSSEVARSVVARANDVSAATPLTSTFTYQGQLKNSGSAVNGLCQMAFRLYDNPSASTNLIGSPITTTVPVTNGLFTVGLNFGSNAFNSNGRWLDIQVNCTGTFVPLSRQALTPAPNALYASNADLLDGLNSSAFVQQTQADARYARISPTTQQLALLKWYTAINGTQPDFGVGYEPAAIAFDGANMWVANRDSSNVSVLRASDGFHVMTVTVGGNPTAIAFDGANMWVANFASSTVSVLRASDGFHVMTPTVGGTPDAIAFDGANMWVANASDNTVSVLRASDGFHVMTPTVGGTPAAIAYDGANVWVGNE